ncbi:MAG: hypothetical protein PVI97_13620 [Candidatus Thiodiazotropha sp.]|jgi:uncharacterized repeat protein (TIGR01451 family)
MVVATPANTSVNCTGSGADNGTLTALSGTDAVSLVGGIIGESGSCSLGVDVVVPTITGTSQLFTNSIPEGEIGNTRGLTSPAFSRDITVNSPISVSKSFSPDTIPAGQPSLLTIVIDNNSTDNTLPITGFLDDLSGTTLSIVDTSTGAPADPSVVCDGSGAASGTLSDGDSNTLDQGDTGILLSNAIAGTRSGSDGKCTISAYVTSTTDGTQTNTIPADAVDNPEAHSSPAASDDLNVNAQLTVEKSVSVNQVAPGQWTEFTVTINNWSGGEVGNVSFRDDLPSSGGHQMVLDDSAGIPVSATGCIGGSYENELAAPVADGDAVLIWTGGSIEAGSGTSPGVCTLVFRARLPATATTGVVFSNQIPINGASGTGTDGAVVNPSASPAVNLSTVDSIALSKSFSPDPIAEGQTSTLQLTIRNRVQSALTDVDLTDNLPAGITLAANPAPNNTCGGSLQAFPGDDQVVLSGGALAARPDSGSQATCTLSVQVTGSTPGSYTNTIDPADFDSSAGTIPESVSDTLTINAGISGIKRFTPSSVTAGGRATVTIIIANNSSGELTNVSVDDSVFSAGLSIANPANATSSCAGTTTLVVNPGATSAQLQGVNLPAGANCDFSFDVTTSGTGPWSNTIPAGNITSAEGSSNSSAISASLTAATADIGINKSFNPIIVTGGMPSLLTIDVINSSGATIHDVGFIDAFPDGIVIYSTPDASTNCLGGTVSATPGSDSVSLSGASLQPNDTCQVYVTTTSLRFLNLTNFIPAGVITSEEGYTNALGTQASLSTLQGLGLTKAFAPAFIAPGETSRLTLELISTFDENAVTPLTLSGISFTDPLPTGLAFAPVPNATTTCTGAALNVNTTTQALTITGGSLLPGTACLIEVDVTAATEGVYNNLILEGAITTDQGATNGSDTAAALTVTAAPTISKAFAPATVNPGESSTLTVTLTNNASVPLTGGSLIDPLPAGLTVYSIPSASTSCADGLVEAISGSSEIILTGATIPADGSCSFSVNVASSITGSLSNTIDADALTTDQGLSNPAPATSPLEVRSPPGISKAFAPASIVTNGTSTLTINLGNSNASDITLTSTLVDALPGNVFVQNPNGLVSDCPGSVTATPGDIQISYANGATVPSGGCSISVDVTSSVDGSYINTIAAGQFTTSAGNNSQPAIATLGVGALFDAAPTIEKDFSPTTMDVNGTSTLTLTLGNPNSSDLTLDADFSDTLPADLVIASPNDLSGSCNLGSVTATPGTTDIIYANGATIAPGGCTISVSVTSATAGSYNNIIQAGDLSTSSGGSNPLPATAGLVVRAPQPPTLDKQISPGTINPGQISRLTLLLGNGNAQAATLTADLVDNLPANMQIAASANVATTCPDSVSTSSDSITYGSGSTIPSGGCTIEVDITSDVSGGPWTNTLASGDLQTDLGSNGTGSSANLFVNPAQPPSISTQCDPDSILSGGVATISISLGNGNATPTLLTADLVNTLPAGVLIADEPNIQATDGCALGEINASPGGNSITYATGGSIPANSVCTISADVTSTSLGTHINTIPANALQTTFGDNSVGTQCSLTVDPILPEVTKTMSPNAIKPGGITRLNINLTNENSVAANLTSGLTDFLPADLVVAPDPDIQATAGCSADNVIALAGESSVEYIAGASIPVGGCSISVALTSEVIGSYNNTISAGSLTTDLGSNPSPTSATVTVAVIAHKVPVMPYWGLVLLGALMMLIARTQLTRMFHPGTR